MKRILVFSILISLVINSFSQSENRIALVIGNASYSSSPLKNTVNDANLMASSLQDLGFTVIKRLNVTKAQMEQAVQQFSVNLSSNNVALFYYAGHGMQSNGINYLIPIDAKLEKESDLKYQAININFIVEEFQQYPQNTNIIILDACRDNPLASWARGGARGFKAISPSSGTIIAFATAEGNTASDGTGKNGLYTSKLVEQMKISQSIESVFKNARMQVQKASGGKQNPQEWSMLTGNFQFVGTENEEQNKSESIIVENSDNKKVETKKSSEIEIVEELITGSIKLSSELDGEFFLDGVSKGNFTKSKIYTLNNIPIGEHTLKLGDWSKEVIVEKDKVTEIKISSSNVTSFIEKMKNLNLEMISVTGDYYNGINIKDYYISKYEITQLQWYIVMGKNPSIFKGCDNCPVENVSWNEVKEFINRLNKMTGKVYRLPTEEEWEYAAFGGKNENNINYAGSNILENVGWYYDNSEKSTHPVGQKQPNSLGIFDMSGNVWEMCSVISDKGIKHLVKGGCYKSNSTECIISSKNYFFGNNPFSYYGFRLVCSN